MTRTNTETQTIPDITKFGKAIHPYSLEKVGMHNMEIPLFLKLFKEQNITMLPAKINAMVNLTDSQTKGIHMSRLYLLVYTYFKQNKDSGNAFSLTNLSELMDMLITSQKGLSNKSHLKISFSYISLRKSLLSENEGARFYPVELQLDKEIGNPLKATLRVTLTYSSTCPCSAALSRQLIRKKVEAQFSTDKVNTKDLLKWLEEDESSLAATPHSQRSFANVEFTFAENPEVFDFEEIIQNLEMSLPTPVQAVVKRKDEQEFARLNGANLIFCEDIARKVKDHLEKDSAVKEYHVKVSHEESLHAHDAVAETFSTS